MRRQARSIRTCIKKARRNCHSAGPRPHAKRRRLRRRCLQRFAVGFAGADAHGLGDFQHEDLAVADPPGVGGFLDRFDDLFRQFLATATSTFTFGRN